MGNKPTDKCQSTHSTEGVVFSYLHPFGARGLQFSLTMMLLVLVESGKLQYKDRNEQWEKRVGDRAEGLAEV